MQKALSTAGSTPGSVETSAGGPSCMGASHWEHAFEEGHIVSGLSFLSSLPGAVKLTAFSVTILL